jgi:flagellar motor switch protein FliN/FliY
MQDIELQEVESSEGIGDSLVNRDYTLLNNVKVELVVQVGTATMTVDELFSIKKGKVLKLNESLDTPINLLLDDKVIAKGKLTVCDDNFAIEVMEVGS